MLQRRSVQEKVSRSIQSPGATCRASSLQPQHDKTNQVALLHPSWSAKQKQKAELVKAIPLGSKTVFSDEGQSVKSKLKPAAAADLGKSRLVPVKHKHQAVQTQAQNLHPSWLAKKAAASKQAQLASCSFATKTIFED